MYLELWMKRDVIHVTPEQTLEEARHLFAENKIRRLPVVSEDILVGIISPGDIEKAMPSILDTENNDEVEYLASTTPIGSVMTVDPVTVSPDASLIEAVEKMRHNKIDGLPVVEAGKLVGIISITNMLDAFLEIMTTKGTSVRLDLKIDHKPDSFFKLMKLLQRQDKEILAIFQHYEFSKDHQLITIQIRGDDNDSLVEQLWDNGVTVEKVTKLN